MLAHSIYLINFVYNNDNDYVDVSTFKKKLSRLLMCELHFFHKKVFYFLITSISQWLVQHTLIAKEILLWQKYFALAKRNKISKINEKVFINHHCCHIMFPFNLLKFEVTFYQLQVHPSAVESFLANKERDSHKFSISSFGVRSRDGWVSNAKFWPSSSIYKI